MPAIAAALRLVLSIREMQYSTPVILVSTYSSISLKFQAGTAQADLRGRSGPYHMC